MPSDDRAQDALAALGRRAEVFRSAISLTRDQLRGFLEARATTAGEAPRAAAALGAFAAGRIDSDRFSRLLASKKAAGSDWAATVERALKVLDELEGRGEDLFRVRVERGADLHAAVERALADAGRAFGAARLANLARSSQYRPEEHDALLEAFPFRRWSRAERQIAPPLVIEVAGSDMLVAGLGAYLDGAQSFVLLVEGHAPPAPLARLVAPGVFVMQTDDAGALTRLAEVNAPAVAAVMPSEAALFVHTPADAHGLGRLEVKHVPSQEPRRPVGSLSVFQQQQELRMLAALAAGPTPEAEAGAPAAAIEVATALPPAAVDVGGGANGASPAGPGAAPDPVGAFANWLLGQVDLSDLESAGG